MKNHTTLFSLVIIFILGVIFIIFFMNIVVLNYVKLTNVKTSNEYFLSHAKLLAMQNIDTTREHAIDTSQKVQIVNREIYFLEENNLYCYSGKSFENRTLIESEITRFLIYKEKIYYVKGSWYDGILYESEKDGKNPNKIMNAITDFTIEEDVILYVQSYSDGDKHKIIEYHKDTGEKKILMKFKMYSDYGGRKIIFFNQYIIIPMYEAIGVYDRKRDIKANFYERSFDSVVPFVFQGNCYISIIFYDGDYDLPIPPVEQERTGIWKFDFKQNKLVQVSKKHARYAEILGDKLTLYNEFTFSPFLAKKYLTLFYPELVYEKDSGL